jgi:hypothetical protein
MSFLFPIDRGMARAALLGSPAGAGKFFPVSGCLFLNPFLK